MNRGTIQWARIPVSVAVIAAILGGCLGTDEACPDGSAIDNDCPGTSSTAPTPAETATNGSTATCVPTDAILKWVESTAYEHAVSSGWDFHRGPFPGAPLPGLEKNHTLAALVWSGADSRWPEVARIEVIPQAEQSWIVAAWLPSVRDTPAGALRILYEATGFPEPSGFPAVEAALNETARTNRGVKQGQALVEEQVDAGKIVQDFLDSGIEWGLDEVPRGVVSSTFVIENETWQVSARMESRQATLASNVGSLVTVADEVRLVIPGRAEALSNNEVKSYVSQLQDALGLPSTGRQPERTFNEVCG